MTKVSRSLSFLALSLLALGTGGCMRDEHDNLASYPEDVRQRHPIVVTRQAAYVPHACGQWPDDVGASGIATTSENTSHWNHGCATQSNLAAMVANPNDLLTPRNETPSNGLRRQNAVAAYQLKLPPNTAHEPIQSLSSVSKTGQ